MTLMVSFDLFSMIIFPLGGFLVDDRLGNSSKITKFRNIITFTSEKESEFEH